MKTKVLCDRYQLQSNTYIQSARKRYSTTLVTEKDKVYHEVLREIEMIFNLIKKGFQAS